MNHDYSKTIVCDIDDTILFTTSRDWENADPNLALISKLNKLHDEGWKIRFLTARGSISCQSREEAKEKYLPSILEFFKKHNIKYSSISFEKPLAQYYIDDKGITPDDFLKLDIQTMAGGLSGAKVEKHGDKVYKTEPNALNTAQWYKKSSLYMPTVKVHSVIGNTICLDFIEEKGNLTIFAVLKMLDNFKNIDINDSCIPNFETYINRIKSHMNLYNPSYYDDYISRLEEYSQFFNCCKSFCHGDFSLDNIIVSDDLYLIDPIYDPKCYSSYLLDIAKLLQSCKRHNKTILYNGIINHYKTYNNLHVISLLEISMWIRMRKYYPDKEYVDKNIELLYSNLS